MSVLDVSNALRREFRVLGSETVSKQLKEKWSEFRRWWTQVESLSLPEILEKAHQIDVISEGKTYLRTHPGLQAVLYWISAMLAGLIAVLYAQAFHGVEELTQSLARSQPYWFLVVAPLGFVASWWLVYRLAPGAGGSGIPQVMAAIETESEYADIRISPLISLKISAVK